MRSFKLSVFGSCAIVIVLLCGGGLSRATVYSLSVDHQAAPSADHTVVTVTGSVVCTVGDQTYVFVNVLMAKSGTVGLVFSPPLTCTGSAQQYSVDVPVSIPTGGEYANGPATGFVEAHDLNDSTAQDVVTKLLIAAANNRYARAAQLLP